jgi:hypothetical protein
MRQPLGIVGIGFVHLHVECLLGMTRIETDHQQALSSEWWSTPGLKTNAHRSRSVPPHCRGDRSGLSRASASPDPIARFIEHVNLRFF